MNVKEDRFGLDRVIGAIGEDAQASAAERARHIALKVREFERGMDPADDLTILALRYLGSEADR